MADESTFVVQMAAWLGQALGDTAPLFADFSSEHLGVELPTAVVQSHAVVSALQHAEATSNSLGNASSQLGTAAASGDEFQILGAFIGLGSALREFYVALNGLVQAVGANVTAITVPDPAARAAVGAFGAALAKKISDYAIASAITDHIPELGFLLRVAGLLDWRYIPPDPGQDLSTHHVRKVLQLDQLKVLIVDPAKHLRDSLAWGDPAFDPADIFHLASDFFHPEDVVNVGLQAGEPFLRIGYLRIRRDATLVPPGFVVELVGSLDADQDDRASINDQWGFNFKGNLRLAGSISGQVTPPLAFKLQPATGQITGELRAFFDRNEEARPFDVIGGTGGLLSIGVNNVRAGVGLKADWNATNGAATINPLVFANIDGATLKIGTSDADSFIGELLSSADIEGQFDLGLEWQADKGLRVTASGGIEVALPIHKELGPVEFDVLYLALKILQDGTLSHEISAGLTGNLGPLTATVERVGVLLDVRFSQGTDADFGPFDLNLRFKPPKGVGLSVDAGAVTGGGYLDIDADRGQYAGAIELVVEDFLNLHAIGLITTKLPDGSSGFSLLIIITADFGTGIQLGFGFTLLKVGGLVGLNRGLLLQPLMDDVRSGAISSILFPQDVVANAQRIISDLQAVFPPQEGTFLIGPMAELGWETFIRLSLGVIIEIPGNIAILGVLALNLPSEDDAVLVLQANFAGALEFDKKRVYFFASLFDSHLLFITIDGEMGVLFAYGDDANFVVTVGGFHPQFNPPPLPFPTPRRLQADIINESYARIRCDGYFAVNTNSAQFGAHAEYYFGFSALDVEGNSGFDALVQFSPFHFSVTVYTHFSVHVFGVGVYGVDINLLLEGPTPWHARGSASIGFLFFSVDVNIDFTWGEDRDTTLPPIAVMPLLIGELQKQSNWRAIPPDASNLLVSLRQLPATEAALVLHPVGRLRFSQRFVPLELTLDKVGNQRPSDANYFELDATAGFAKTGEVSESFAPGQFKDFDDADKLSQPAYEPEPAGLELAPAGVELDSGTAITRIVRYNLTVIDTSWRRVLLRFFVFAGSLFTHYLGGASVTRNAFSKYRQSQVQPFSDKVTVKPEVYTVALRANNKAADSRSFTSQAAADDYMNSLIVRDPTLGGTLHVLPQFEVAA